MNKCAWLIAVVFITACAQPATRPDTSASPEAAPTAGPPPMASPGEVFMAMDEESDPAPPGGHPDVSSIGDLTVNLENIGYDVVYSETKQNPLVISYFLKPRSSEDITGCVEPDRFITDDRTQARVTHGHYTNTGYDRGHMAPNATIRRRFGCEAMRETFFASNIVPQRPGLNQITWGGHENVVENQYATNFEGVWVLTGPIFHPTEIITLKNTDVEVPEEFWKIVIRRTDEGDVDAAVIVMKKAERRKTKAIEVFSTTIDDIEVRTGIDFFPDLPDAEEIQLESACPGEAWLLDTILTTNFGGDARPLKVDGPEPRVQPLGTQIGHAPTCAPE